MAEREDSRERTLREAAQRRMEGLVALARKRRDEDRDGSGIADAAYILGAVSDFSDYVAWLRGIE